MNRPALLHHDDLHAALTQLLGGSPDSVTPCASGGNNRVFRVDYNGCCYLAKSYFTGPGDRRDRLDSEWRFLSYAWHTGIDTVPRPVARDDGSAIAVYGFLEGVRPAQADAGLVRQAGRFITALNARPDNAEARALPSASESCLTAKAHIELLRGRIERLRDGQAHADHAVRFRAVCERIENAFTHHTEALLSGYAALGLPPDRELPQVACCLSPSDFGFHNTLLHPSGRLQFIDFEYAGWDDPAKMLCDFFLHPGVPVDRAWKELFWQEIAAMPVDLSQAAERARLLFPLLGLRWCCIMLNVFVPDWAARRQFADPRWDARMAQAQQLDKAEQMLYTVNEPF